MEIQKKYASKRRLSGKNTQINLQPVKKSMLQNPKPKQFAIIVKNKATKTNIADLKRN